MPPEFLLTEEEILALRQIRRYFDNVRINREKFSFNPDDIPAPEMYVAKPPSGGIPKLSGSRPGVASCDIYKIVRDSDGPDLVQLEDTQKEVFNYSPVNVDGDNFVAINREKAGSWVAIPGLVNDTECPYIPGVSFDDIPEDTAPDFVLTIKNGCLAKIPVGYCESGGTGSADADELVKVSSNDTTAGYLNGKLVAGSGITLTENNDGLNETFTISATGGSAGTGTDDFAIGAGAADGRLTVVNEQPVANGTGAANFYYTPYTGNRIALWTNGHWEMFQFSQLNSASFSITIATDTVYDIFIHDNAGTLTLSVAAWTSHTVRTTALIRQDGVLVKSGSPTHRYLGSILGGASTDSLHDDSSRRHLWNMYNRVQRPLLAQDTTNSWSYTTQSWREANGGSTLGTSRVCVLLGLDEALLQAQVYAAYFESTAGFASVGIGLDSTTVNSAQFRGGLYNQMGALYQGFPGAGKRVVSWLEYGRSGATFYGDVDATGRIQSGLQALILG